MSNNINDTFTYSIYPNRPIKDLIPGKSIRKPVSLQLTKEDVLHCMKYGPVFRIIPGKDPIRVTGSNLDQLHQSPFKQQVSENTDNHTEDKENEQNQEQEDTEDIKLDDPEDEFLNQEPDFDDSIPSNDTLEVPEEEDIESDKAVEQPVQEVVPEKVQINPQQVKFNNNYNKKKNRHH